MWWSSFIAANLWETELVILLMVGLEGEAGSFLVFVFSFHWYFWNGTNAHIQLPELGMQFSKYGSVKGLIPTVKFLLFVFYQVERNHWNSEKQSNGWHLWYFTQLNCWQLNHLISVWPQTPQDQNDSHSCWHFKPKHIHTCRHELHNCTHAL